MRSTDRFAGRDLLRQRHVSVDLPGEDVDESGVEVFGAKIAAGIGQGGDDVRVVDDHHGPPVAGQ